MTTKLAEWASEHRQITRNRPSHARGRKTFQRRSNSGMVGVSLKVIWEMSKETRSRGRLTIPVRTFSAAAAIVAVACGPAFAACEGIKLFDVSGGSFDVDSALMSAWSAGGETVSLVLPMHIIDHPRGLIVFDTGISDDFADGGCEAFWGAALCQPLSLNWRREDVIDRQLEKLGYAIDQVRYVIYSHFHWDHAGNIESFPKATHVVQKVELQHAWWPEKLFRGVFAMKDFDETRDFDFMELTGDFDLFGDGCVRLISTPGHTPGHQSLLVTLPQTGPVLLMGDAASSPEQVEGVPPGFTQSLMQSFASIEKLKRIRDAEGAQMWITHDLEQYNARKHDTAYE